MPFDLVLMTSGMAYWYPGVQETVRFVRQCSATVPVVLGGSYARLYPDHAARNSGADHVFQGVADEGLDHVLQKFGLSLQSAGEPMRHSSLSLYDRHPYAPLLTSTGCPFRCSYCASKILFPTYSRRPVVDILDEMAAFVAAGVRDFAFYDDALLYEAEYHIMLLLEEVVRKGWQVRLHAPNGLHAASINDDLAGLMKRAGFQTIRLSLETVDPERQKQTGGKVRSGDLERSVALFRKHGFTKEHIGVYLMYGLPGQALQEVEQGIAFLMQLDVRIHLVEFSPIRGTACWTDLVRQKIIPDDLDPLLTNNTVFSLMHSEYDTKRVAWMKVSVQKHNKR